jgi:hypothetical protein
MLSIFRSSSKLTNTANVYLPGKPEDVFVSGAYAYLVGYTPSPFLAVVDIVDPSNPVVRSFVPTGGRSIHVSGSRAYVAGPTGLTVYDISDPDEVVLLGSTADMASAPSSIYVSGSRAYVTMEGSDSLVVYDISDSETPVVLGSSPTGSLVRPVSVMVSGDHAFVASEGDPSSAENNGVVILDISDPAGIVVRGTTAEEGQRATALSVAGKRVFVTSVCTTEECKLTGEDKVADDRFGIYEFNHLQSPTLQTGNLQAGYLDVIDSASISNGLSVGGGLNAGQAYVGGDLGLGGDLRMLGSIGMPRDAVCIEWVDEYHETCLDWYAPRLTFNNDISTNGHRIVGTRYPHCPVGQWLEDLSCCGVADYSSYQCLADVTPVVWGFYDRVTAVDGHLVPSCDAGECLPNSGGWNLGDPELRWDTIWAANGVIQTSDERLKENVVPLKYGIAEVMKLEPVTFSWINDTGERYPGLIAQEVQMIMPEVVRGSADEESTLGLNYSELVPVLISAIQDLHREVSEQSLVIEKMEKRLQAFEANGQYTVARGESGKPGQAQHP